jgi:heme/copper-type cytochrome/quinol oxidase subunit 2
MKNKKHIICLVMIIISVCAMSLLIYIWTIHRNDKNSEAATDYLEYKTDAEMFGVTPMKITSIKVVVNSGTAKGNEYNLTKEEKTDIYNNIVKTFWKRHKVFSNRDIFQKSYPTGLKTPPKGVSNPKVVLSTD